MLPIDFPVIGRGFDREVGVFEHFVLKIVKGAFICKRIARNANLIARATTCFLQGVVDANTG